MPTPVEKFQRERNYEGRRRTIRRAVFWCSIITAFTLLSMLVFAKYADGSVSGYPSVTAAHQAIHVALDAKAADLHSRVVVGSCRRKWKHTLACDTQFRGESPLRLRLHVQQLGEYEYFVSGAVERTP